MMPSWCFMLQYRRRAMSQFYPCARMGVAASLEAMLDSTSDLCIATCVKPQVETNNHPRGMMHMPPSPREPTNVSETCSTPQPIITDTLDFRMWPRCAFFGMQRHTSLLAKVCAKYESLRWAAPEFIKLASTWQPCHFAVATCVLADPFTTM